MIFCVLVKIRLLKVQSHEKSVFEISAKIQKFATLNKLFAMHCTIVFVPKFVPKLHDFLFYVFNFSNGLHFFVCLSQSMVN